MKLIATFALSLLTFGLSAQSTIEVKDNTIDIGVFIPGVNESKYDAVVGSPYIHDDFLPATINDLRKTQLIRFNTVDHDVEAKTEKGIMRLDLKNDYTIKLLDGSNKKYTTGKYKSDEGKTISTFFEIMENIGNHQLYKKERKKFIKKQKTQAYQDAQSDKFIPISDAYYITNFKSKSENLLEIPRKKKKFYSFFGNHSKKISQFVKQDKLDISKEEDLIKIFKYYFSIKK